MNPRILKIIVFVSSFTRGTADVDYLVNYDDIRTDVQSDSALNGNRQRTPVPTDANQDFGIFSGSFDSQKVAIANSPTKNFIGNHVAPELEAFQGTSGYVHGDGESSLRNKRTLTFPDPSTILLIFGIGTPLQLDRESIIVGAFTKMIYNLPLNSSDFTEPGVYFARTKTRWSIYKVLERTAEVYGLGGGKACLLRAICEVAAAPFDLHHGLFGQIAQAFLTPSSTSEPYDDYGDREYHAAESLGRNSGENCHALYPECRRSFLDVFSTTEGSEKTTPTTTTASFVD